jgi:hypothetical protein
MIFSYFNRSANTDTEGMTLYYNGLVDVPTLRFGGTYVPTTAGASGQVLTADGNGNATWSALPSNNLSSAATGILPVANGGTGSSTQNFVDLTTAQTVAGNKTFSGNTSVGGTLGVTGASTLTGNTSVGGTLGVTGDVAVNTNKFTVTAASGNTAIAGTLGVTGASTLTGYVYGNGVSAMTASTTIPSTAVTGLGTMSTQNSNNIVVTGGSMSGVTISDYVAIATKGVANGVASLDGSGTVPVSQLPAAVLGAFTFFSVCFTSGSSMIFSFGLYSFSAIS